MTNALSIDPLALNRIQSWLDGPYDEKTKSEVRSLLANNPQAANDAFFTDLSFGTGGLRALMGVGSCRLNLYTIGIATQGLANYLLQQKKSNISVFIGFDSRHHSLEFAREAACVLAGNGIRVYLTQELRPVAYVSFGCRYHHCDAAVMITASHNPKEYNGYKVYWSDGAQVVDPHDTGITQEMGLIHSPIQVKRSTLSDPKITTVDSSFDMHFLDAIRPLQLLPKENKSHGSSLKITYTSLHGTGITMVPKALADWGFTNINYVEEQIKPDGNFPTVPFPNPECPQALKLGTEALIKTHSDLLIANDPDADRMGVVVMHQGVATPLNGNEAATLCVDYLCEVLTNQGRVPKNGAFVTTIVTTELLKTIAAHYKIPCIEVLTGFKYIGEKMRLWESDPSGYTFIFGAEESYGCLLGTYARDKDAIIGSCLFAEIALYAKMQGQTLVDRLHLIYKKYGMYREKQLSLNFNPGKEGMDQMQTLMTHLRKTPPKIIGNQPVISIQDFEMATHLPKSNVLKFTLADQSALIIRPSGTEPKIKIYGSVSEKKFLSIADGIATCDQRLNTLLMALKNDIS